MSLFTPKFRRECQRAYLKYSARGTTWHGTVELEGKERVRTRLPLRAQGWPGISKY